MTHDLLLLSMWTVCFAGAKWNNFCVSLFFAILNWKVTFISRDMNHAWSFQTAELDASYFLLSIYKYISQHLPWCHAVDTMEHLVFASNILDDRRFELMCLWSSVLWEIIVIRLSTAHQSWHHEQLSVLQWTLFTMNSLVCDM